MTKQALALLVCALSIPAITSAQAPTSAIYITAEQVQEVNAVPGIDRQIVSTDIGKLNLSVGVIHRGTLAPPSRRPAAQPSNNPRPGELCGVGAGTDSGARGIAHIHQTETYVVISGGGTLVTGGRIMDGRMSSPESSVTTTLNGPSCSGEIVGDVQAKDVKVGDIVIIPAGVPHGWSSIPDHVTYLSVRPDPDRVLPDDYVNPAITIGR